MAGCCMGQREGFLSEEEIERRELMPFFEIYVKDVTKVNALGVPTENNAPVPLQVLSQAYTVPLRKTKSTRCDSSKCLSLHLDR